MGEAESSAFYAAAEELGADLAENRLFLPPIMQAALRGLIATAFSAAGGIYAQIPVVQAGEYSDEVENFVVVECAAAAVQGGEAQLFARSISTNVILCTNRDLAYETAGRLFHGLLLLLQPEALLDALRAAVAAVDPRLRVVRVADNGETQNVDPDGRTFSKSLILTAGYQTV